MQQQASLGWAPMCEDADVCVDEPSTHVVSCRCVHIHKCLGKLSTVREQYATQRGLQLKADLEPPADFLGSYQTYIAQVLMKP